MELTYREGNAEDVKSLRELGVSSWTQFRHELTTENWDKLNKSISDENTYVSLVENSTCFVCTALNQKIVGMAFLVSSGNPTDIYDKEWCYIRFVTVDPAYSGQGIGKQLTQLCIQFAKARHEKTIALHTSEMMDKARHIYESLGFTILKEIDRRFGKRYWLYILDINSPG
jgi:ribosomal protein S18 acetylase RimI-like enzyme